MLQKIIQIGNSLGITLPREFVVKNKIRKGSEVDLNHKSGSLTLSTKKPKVTKYQEISDKEFFGLVKKVESQYGKALQELADLDNLK